MQSDSVVEGIVLDGEDVIFAEETGAFCRENRYCCTHMTPNKLNGYIINVYYNSNI